MFDKIDRNKLLLYVNDKDKLIDDVNLKSSVVKKLLFAVIMLVLGVAWIIKREFASSFNSNALFGLYIIILAVALVVTLPLVAVLLINKKRKAKKLLKNGEIKVLKINVTEFELKEIGFGTSDRYKIFAEIYNFQTGNMERRISILTNSSEKNKQVIGKSGTFAKELSIDEDLIRVNNYIVVLEYKNKFHFLPNKLWERARNV